MSKGKKLIDRVVDRAVDEAAIRGKIEELKRQRRVIIEDLDFILHHYAAEEEDDDECGEGEFDEDDYNNDEESGEWSEVFDNEMEREIG